MVTLPRKREEIIKELREIKKDCLDNEQGRNTRAICILAEIILDKDYDYLEDVNYKDNHKDDLIE